MTEIHSLKAFLSKLSNQSPSHYHHKFSVDTRTLKKGDVFIALPGNKCNGSSFLSDAIEKGAIGAVLPNHIEPKLPIPTINVKDPLEMLQSLAQEKISFFSPKIIAITGSVGKTTSKEFLTTLLIEKFKVFSTPGNYNSQIGLPLAILNEMKGDEEIAILEMGMSQRGNIRRLIEIAPPEIAMITHVAHAHMQNFSDLLEVAREKADILSHPKTKIGFISETIEEKSIFYQTGFCEKKIFSLNEQKAIELLELLNPPFKEKHLLNNLWGTITIALYLGCSIMELKEQIAKLILPEKRFNKTEKKGICFINDSYNACPVSVKAGLDSLPKPKQGRKIISILGDMLELGRYSEILHREIGFYSLDKADLMFCLGKETKPIVDVWHQNNREVYHYEKLSDLLQLLKQTVMDGDVVFVKGSRANEMWKIVEDF